MITIKERNIIVDALFEEFDNAHVVPDTWAIFKRMRTLIVNMSQYTGIHDHMCPCGEEWMSTNKVEKERIKQVWEEFLNATHKVAWDDLNIEWILTAFPNWVDKRED